MPHWLALLLFVLAGWFGVSLVGALVVSRLLRLNMLGGHERGFVVVAQRLAVAEARRRRLIAEKRHRVA